MGRERHIGKGSGPAQAEGNELKIDTLPNPGKGENLSHPRKPAAYPRESEQ